MIRLGALKVVAAAVVFTVVCVNAAMSGTTPEVHSKVPGDVDPGKKYIFYMHGAWIERFGLKSTNPRQGRYEYSEIVRAFTDEGFVVISEVRRSDVNLEEYANEQARQVVKLIEMGVPPERITVLGHSKGGLMAMLVASILQDSRINYAILAGCGKKGPSGKHFTAFTEKHKAQFQGRVLSIYSEQDKISGSCEKAFAGSDAVEFKEVVLKSRKGHGLFYAPDPSWVGEVVMWADQAPASKAPSGAADRPRDSSGQ